MVDHVYLLGIGKKHPPSLYIKYAIICKAIPHSQSIKGEEKIQSTQKTAARVSVMYALKLLKLTLSKCIEKIVLEDLSILSYSSKMFFMIFIIFLYFKCRGITKTFDNCVWVFDILHFTLKYHDKCFLFSSFISFQTGKMENICCCILA